MATDALVYLTVQDMLYINLQATKKVNAFDFARLEEGTFYQYGYGPSKDLLRQAQRFSKGFLKNAPFTEGNELTALIGTLAFLEVNGYTIDHGSAMGSTTVLTDEVIAGAKQIANWHASTHPTTREAIEAVAARLAG